MRPSKRFLKAVLHADCESGGLEVRRAAGRIDFRCGRIEIWRNRRGADPAAVGPVEHPLGIPGACDGYPLEIQASAGAWGPPASVARPARTNRFLGRWQRYRCGRGGTTSCCVSISFSHCTATTSWSDGRAEAVLCLYGFGRWTATSRRRMNV